MLVKLFIIRGYEWMKLDLSLLSVATIASQAYLGEESCYLATVVKSKSPS